MSEDIQNKESASEDDVGRLHRMVTQCFTAKLSKQLKKANRPKGNANIDINTLDLAAAARWISYNGIKSANATEESLGKITDELKEIRDRNRGKKLKAVGDD